MQVALNFLVFTLWASDRVIYFILNAVGAGDNQPHPIRSCHKRGRVIDRKCLFAEGIKCCVLGGHRATLLSLEAPLDGRRAIGFDRPGDLNWKDRTHATGHADRAGVHIHADVDHTGLGRFHDRNACYIASRVGHARGYPTSSS